MSELTMTSASATFYMFLMNIFSRKSPIYCEFKYELACSNFEKPLQEPGESCHASVTIHDTETALNKIHLVWL